MPIRRLEGGGFIATGTSIKLVQMLAQRGALKLEALGMKRRGRSMLAVVKNQYGLNGSRAKVLAQLDNLILREREGYNQ